MAYTSRDIISLSQARAHFSELADEVRAGAEKIITRNGESYVALVDASKLDHYHRLEAAHGELVLLEQALIGLNDLRDGRVSSARAVLDRVKATRSKRASRK
jgi:prevent-host-death family protein